MRHCLTGRTIEYWTLSENSAFPKNPILEIQRWIGQIRSEPRTARQMSRCCLCSYCTAGVLWVQSWSQFLPAGHRISSGRRGQYSKGCWSLRGLGGGHEEVADVCTGHVRSSAEVVSKRSRGDSLVRSAVFAQSRADFIVNKLSKRHWTLSSTNHSTIFSGEKSILLKCQSFSLGLYANTHNEIDKMQLSWVWRGREHNQWELWDLNPQFMVMWTHSWCRAEDQTAASQPQVSLFEFDWRFFARRNHCFGIFKKVVIPRLVRAAEVWSLLCVMKTGLCARKIRGTHFHDTRRPPRSQHLIVPIRGHLSSFSKNKWHFCVKCATYEKPGNSAGLLWAEERPVLTPFVLEERVLFLVPPVAPPEPLSWRPDGEDDWFRVSVLCQNTQFRNSNFQHFSLGMDKETSSGVCQARCSRLTTTSFHTELPWICRMFPGRSYLTESQKVQAECDFKGAATQARLFLTRVKIDAHQKISPTIFNQGGHTASVYQAFIFQNISTDIFDARQFWRASKPCVAAPSAAAAGRWRRTSADSRTT